MMSEDVWASSPTISDPKYWEECFPGYGAVISAFMSQFQNWVPNPELAQPGLDLEKDMLEALRWLGVETVRVVSTSRGQEALATISVLAPKAFATTCHQHFAGRKDLPNWMARNYAIAESFGPVIGHDSITTHLRTWLYEWLLNALLCLVADDTAPLASLRTILDYWLQGNYLVGFSQDGAGGIVAHVFVADTQ